MQRIRVNLLETHHHELLPDLISPNSQKLLSLQRKIIADAARYIQIICDMSNNSIPYFKTSKILVFGKFFVDALEND
jgi:hypothetical protein